jgi:hypothetical protein
MMVYTRTSRRSHANLHPMVTNNNGPRWNASHRPLGVKIEFLQRQYTLRHLAKKRRKYNYRRTICSGES